MPDTLDQPTIGDDAAAMPRQCMRCATGASNGTDRSKPRTIQPRLQIIAQILLAAKEMWDARDIGHQPIGAITAHHRRVAPRPTPQRCQRRSFGCQVRHAGGEIWADGTRIRQCHAAPQAARDGGQIDAVQMIGIAKPVGQRKRPLNGAYPQARVAGEPRKPYGQQPSRHSSLQPNRQLFPFCS